MRTRIGMVVVVVAWSRLAVGQPAPNADAEARFEQARQFMDAGNFAQACEAFDDSQRIEPALTTLMNQANCRERNNQLATAWTLFKNAETEASTRTDEAGKQMRTSAATRIAKLEARLSKLTIIVPSASRLDGLVVAKNDAPIDATTWNAPVWIDGGTYTIRATAPGMKEWSTTITIAAERDAKTIEIPNLAASVATPPPKASPIVEQPSRWTPKRKIAIGLAAGGGAALLAGTFLGLSGKSLQDEVDELCPDPSISCSNATRANELSESAHSRGIYANVAFGVGAAALITAGVLWFVGGPESATPVAITASANEVGFVATGRF